MNSQTIKSTVDVRDIIPRQRHSMIFGIFSELVPGEVMLLVNDHDPKPLHYQFQAELPGHFTWDYVEQGPEVWQVHISRLAACCS